MSMQHKVNKPKTARGKRFVKNREPKVYENTKQALAVRTNSANEKVLQILRDLAALKKPDSSVLGRRHDFRPFDDEQALEKLSMKYDSSLLVAGTHNKKRPHCITFCRMFDYHILDMFEFCVENFKAISEFEGPTPPLGNKPMLIFRGDAFEHNPIYQKVKSCFTDYFRGPTVDKVRPAGIVHAITFTCIQDRIYLRTFAVENVSGGKESAALNASFRPMGPSMDLVLKRHKLASDDLWKVACKQPIEAKIKKTKNISKDVFGSQLGRIHMETQDFSRLVTRKMKGLRKDEEVATTESTNGMEGGGNAAEEEDWEDIGGELD